MAGFANRVKTFTYPDLTEPGERVLFVTIRDPRTVPSDDLVPPDVPRDANGVPLDKNQAEQRTREVIARLIVGWRMYDATDFALDDEGNPIDQALLPSPATADTVARLPIVVMHQINTAIAGALNPR